MQLKSKASNDIPEGLIMLLAVACGAIAANLYYAQPIVDAIGQTLNMSVATTVLIVTLTQLGYGFGLLFVVPMADKFENRALVLFLISITSFSLVGLAVLSSPLLFLATSFLLGLSSVAVQVLVPYASHLVAEGVRGGVVGKVMSGLMLGIMLARPISSFITEYLSWHAVFFISAGFMLLLGISLWRLLPVRQLEHSPSYKEILMTMVQLVLNEPILRRRALYHAAMFGIFSLFWTIAPLLLLSPTFGLSHQDVALFALAGVAGAISAPIAGRMADQGRGRLGSALAMLVGAISFAMTIIAVKGTTLSFVVLVIAAILIDFAVTANLVFGQREIYRLNASLRGRLNGIYMATFFMGGAFSSAVGGMIYTNDGWQGVVLTGTLLPLLAFVYLLTERK